jgi:hypothetical protein
LSTFGRRLTIWWRWWEPQIELKWTADRAKSGRLHHLHHHGG